MTETPPRKGGWPGPARPDWQFRPIPRVAEAVAAHLRKYGGSRSSAINGLITEHLECSVSHSAPRGGPPNIWESFQAVLTDNERLALALEVCRHALREDHPAAEWLAVAREASLAAHDSMSRPRWAVDQVGDMDLRKLAEETLAEELP